LTQAWTTFSTQVGLGALLLAVGIGGIYSDLFSDVGSLSGFFIFNAQAYTHIKRFTRALTRMEESVGASVRLQELLDEEPDIVEAEGAVELDGFYNELAFRDISFEYPEGDGSALSHLDLEVRRGETLAIVGSSGSGKSTLMALVCRFFDPTTGVLEVDGHDLRNVSLDSWTSLFSMVDQAPFLFHTSIAENLRYGKRDATDDELVAACKAAQIHDFIESLPEGYQTNVADAGARLSGGQRQRITIARALLKGAPILLLDEATSALDTESERGVQEALETLMEGRTVIVIAHRLSTIQNADRICVLEHGKLVELGTHAELSAKGGAYARALELQKMA
jgi:subfamily B ATP-binding cassette protein MsbA